MSQVEGTRNGVYGTDGATFEQSFSRLQEVVGRLSAGNLTLQDALAAFEEGMALADRCARMLEEAELRVKQVSAKAVRAGTEAVARLEEVVTDAPAPGQTRAAIFESVEQRVAFGFPTEPQAPTRQAGTGISANLPWEGPASPVQRPGTRPAAPGGPTNEDKYAEDLELGPLFDDEDE